VLDLADAGTVRVVHGHPVRQDGVGHRFAKSFHVLVVPRDGAGYASAASRKASVTAANSGDAKTL
jgi:hypothetical protein